MISLTPLFARLVRTEAFLLQHAELWQPAPFHQTPDWVLRHPDLYDALIALTDAQCERLEHDSTALAHWLGQYQETLTEIPALIALPRAHSARKKPWPTGFEWDVPGRKWAQIENFVAALTPRTATLVDWCAGKGHLSRSVAFQHERPIIALEWDLHLCDAAEQLSHKHHTPVTPIRQDVLDTSAADHITRDRHCIALHACGKLHLQLMRLASQKQAPALSISPCCYHLIDTSTYTPLSPVAPALLPQRLVLTRDQLRLAVQETVTANGHARRLRDRKSAWRLGFRQWVQSHWPTAKITFPSLPDRCFHGNFDDFCRHMLAHVTPPPDSETTGDSVASLQSHFDSSERMQYEQAGWTAYRQVQRLELVRHGFRRVLELWLCLDRACWLETQGYDITLSEFCAPQVTPRNLLIDAVRSPRRPP